jgi:hypothetical protein
MPGGHEIHAWTVSSGQARDLFIKIFKVFFSNPRYVSVAACLLKGDS